MADDLGYGSGTSSGGTSAYLDGLLEGHESKAVQYLYKGWIFCYLTFGLFGIISSFATMKEPGFTVASILISASILGFILFSLFLIKNYREMNLDPVWKKAAYFVMLFTMLLAGANAILMHQAFEKAECASPETTTTTTTTETPTPNGPISSTTPGGPTTTPPNASSVEQYLRKRLETQMPKRLQQLRQQQPWKKIILYSKNVIVSFFKKNENLYTKKKKIIVVLCFLFIILFF